MITVTLGRVLTPTPHLGKGGNNNLEVSLKIKNVSSLEVLGNVRGHSQWRTSAAALGTENRAQATDLNDGTVVQVEQAQGESLLFAFTHAQRLWLASQKSPGLPQASVARFCKL
jgi:hypothetical protein